MCDEYMPLIRLPMSIDDFHRLPRNAAYKYEYLGGETYLSPRPKTMHCVLDFATCSFAPDDLAPASEYRLAPLSADLLSPLAQVMSGAFQQTQPFASLLDQERLNAVTECLTHTFAGEEGPLIGDASFIARRVEDDTLVGAILVTLLPEGEPTDFATYTWPKSTPPEQRTKGQPHVTWIFTHHFFKGDGIGTTLLAAAIDRLRDAGHRRLLSTFLAGNDSSMLWHWRNGFRLVPYAGSHRRWRGRSKINHDLIAPGGGGGG